MTTRHRSPVGSIRRALALLDELRSDGPMRLSDLSRRTGIPKSTTHRTLSSLMDVGAATRNGRRYAASGPFGHRRHTTLTAAQLSSLRGLAPFTGDVLVRTGLTASIAVLQGSDVGFYHRVHGHDSPWTPSDDTGLEVAPRTAAGLLLMAYSTEIAEQGVDAVGLHPDHAVDLEALFARIRRARFAIRSTDTGVVCIAVPVPLIGQNLQTALTVKGQVHTFDQNRVLHRLRHVADAMAHAGQCAVDVPKEKPSRQCNRAVHKGLEQSRAMCCGGVGGR